MVGTARRLTLSQSTSILGIPHWGFRKTHGLLQQMVCRSLTSTTMAWKFHKKVPRPLLSTLASTCAHATSHLVGLGVATCCFVGMAHLRTGRSSISAAGMMGALEMHLPLSTACRATGLLCLPSLRAKQSRPMH